MKPSIATEWLPKETKERIKDEEPVRFAAAVAAAKREWERCRALPDTVDPQEAMRCKARFDCAISAVYNLLRVACRADLRTHDVSKLVHVLLDVVYEAGEDVKLQGIAARLLEDVLRSFRRRLDVSIPWRPLLSLFCSNHMALPTAIQQRSTMVSNTDDLLHLVACCRVFFPLGSAAEIWAHFRPHLLDTNRAHAFESLSLLSAFLPTTELARDPHRAPWAEWLDEWLVLWDALPACPYWSSRWCDLFQRVLRDDVRGHIPWPDLCGRLSAHFLHAFNIPAGISDGGQLQGAQVPSGLNTLFGGRNASEERGVAASLVHMLGRCGPAALDVLDAIATQLEHYCQPGNEGPWSRSIFRLLDTFTSTFMTRLAKEARLRALRAHATVRRGRGGGASELAEEDDDDDAYTMDIGDDVEMIADLEAMHDGDEDEDEDMDEDSDGDDDDSMMGSQEGGGGMQRRMLSTSTRVMIDAPTAKHVALQLFRLASRAMYAKDLRDTSLGSQARHMLYLLSYIIPHKVFPLACRRFSDALQAASAVHQLNRAISVMSSVVRPMLEAGAPSEAALDADDGAGAGFGAGWAAGGGSGADASGPKNSSGLEDADRLDVAHLDLTQLDVGLQKFSRPLAAEMVGRAMELLLAAFDANDPSKTQKAMKFYVRVLSTVTWLPDSEDAEWTAKHGDALTVPLDTEVFLGEFLERVFALITNLDTPGSTTRADTALTAGQDQARKTFLSSNSSLYLPMLQLLLARVSPRLRVVAVRHVAKFLSEASFNTAMSDAAFLAFVCQGFCPEETARDIFQPATEQLREELRFHRAAPRISPGVERSVMWLVEVMCLAMGREVPRQQLVVASELLADAWELPSVAVQLTCGVNLSRLALNKSQLHMRDRYAPHRAPRGGRCGADLEETVGLASSAVDSQMPWDSEDAASRDHAKWVLEHLLQRFLVEPLDQFDALMARPPVLPEAYRLRREKGESAESAHRAALRSVLSRVQNALRCSGTVLADFTLSQDAAARVRDSNPVGARVQDLRHLFQRVSTPGGPGSASKSQTPPRTPPRMHDPVVPEGPEPWEALEVPLCPVDRPSLDVLLPGVRERCAESLSRAAPQLMGQDSQTLKLLLSIISRLLNVSSSNGTLVAALDQQWRSLAQVACDPPLAPLLFHDVLGAQVGAGGADEAESAPPRTPTATASPMAAAGAGSGEHRRFLGGAVRPGTSSLHTRDFYTSQWRFCRWVVVKHVESKAMLRRTLSSQWGWQSSEVLIVKPEDLNPAYLRLLDSLVGYCTHKYSAVSSSASATLSIVSQRYPGLAQRTMYHFLSILANPERPLSSPAPMAIDGAPGAAAEPATPDAAVPDGEGQDQATEESRVFGATVGVISTLSQVFEDAGLMAAFLGSVLALVTSPSDTPSIIHCTITIMSEFSAQLRRTGLAVPKPGHRMQPVLRDKVFELLRGELSLEGKSSGAAPTADGGNGAAPQQKAAVVGWRAVVFGSALLAYVALPVCAQDEEMLAALTAHFGRMSMNRFAPFSVLGRAVVTLMLRQEARGKTGAVSRHLAALLAPPSGETPADTLVDALVHDRSLVAEAASAQEGMAAMLAPGQGTSLEHKVASGMAVLAQASGRWPVFRTAATAALYDGTFELAHVVYLSSMLDACPGQAIPVLKRAVTGLVSTAGHTDLSQWSAAAEIMAALMGCLDTYRGGHWDEWARACTLDALRRCPNQVQDAWTAALRYAWARLLGGNLHERWTPEGNPAPQTPGEESLAAAGEVAALMQEAPNEAAGWSAVRRYIERLGWCIEEAVQTGSVDAAPVRKLIAVGFEQVELRRSNPYVRSSLACLMTSLAALGRPHGHPETPEGSLYAAPLKAMLDRALQDLVAGAELLRERLAVVGGTGTGALGSAWGSHPHTPPVGTEGGGGGPGPEGAAAASMLSDLTAAMQSGDAEVVAQVSRSCARRVAQIAPKETLYKLLKVSSDAEVTAKLASLDPEHLPVALTSVLTQVLGNAPGGVAARPAQRGSKRKSPGDPAPDANGGDVAMAGGDDAAPRLNEHPAVVRAHLSISFIMTATHVGVSIRLWNTMMDALPHVLWIQGIQDQSLAQVASDAWSALLLVAHHPVRDEPSFARALDAIRTAAESPQRQVAITALQYCHFLCFKHQLSMPLSVRTAAEDLFVQGLADRRVEVRNTAMQCLAAVVKTIAPARHKELRRRFLTEIQAVSASSKRRRTQPPTREELAVLQAPVHGLSAFVLSSPYDVPTWMPGVISALVKAGFAERRAREVITKTLSTFQRTHERETGIAELRSHFSEDDWDAFRSLAAPCTYFC
ncbi:unnamed protein product [Pedinophyceae sp. YPF-701]|nr:unnamed protein product [Pedinophyceae sp. YPF-701]